MSGLISSLYTGQSGLAVNQTGIEVSGNNVSNANTEGYSRQSVQTVSMPTLELNGNFVGRGATVSDINRAESTLVTSQLVSNSADYGEEACQAESLTALENIVGISDGSLSSVIDDFFDAWQSLSGNPSAALEREEVLQAGEQLADTFQQMDQDLADLQDNIDQELMSDVVTLNSQLEQLADLNGRVIAMEAGGTSANGLRDERDLLLQEVAETIGIQYYEQDNGGVSVQLSSGVSLVLGSDFSSLQVERSGGTVQLSVATGSTEVEIDSDDLGGEFKGLLTVRDETIAETRSDLDQLAYQLAESVNAVQGDGTDLNGDVGSDFFAVSSSSDPDAPWSGAASSIALALSDGDLVAAGTSTDTDALSGDNSNCLSMVALQTELTMDNTSSFQDYYEQIAAGIGTEVSRNQSATDNAEDVLVQLQNMRDSIAGVSIDEEMVLLTQYQTGYEAAARYLSVVQDMLDTLMAL